MKNDQSSKKNVFDENFDQNLFSGTNLNFSDSFEHSKNPKYGRQQDGANMVVRNPKTY